MKRAFALTLPVLLWAAAFPGRVEGQSIRTNAGFLSQTLAANDDGSTGGIPLGFTINFFGKLRSIGYVNNNGNITFDSPLATYTPFGLDAAGREIIAPFFADVDTRAAHSKLVTFGQDTVNGHPAFGINYVDVGYYNVHDDKLNSFQVVLIERNDTGNSNFDIEFNYGRITWETGDASGGVGGLGGVSATVGWSNGTGQPGTSFQLPGSMIPGSFLDNGPDALVRARIANQPTATAGRLLYHARDGMISPGLEIVTGDALPDATVGVPYKFNMLLSGGKAPISWQMIPDVSGPPGLSLTSAGVLSGTPTTAGTYTFTLTLTANTEDGTETISRRGSLTINPPQVNITTACPMPVATAGQPYALRLQATGGSAPYQWTIANPYALPAGIGLSGGGLLGGTPLSVGTYMIPLRASSGAADGSTPASKLCALTVNAPQIRVSSGCLLPAATVGVPYTQVLGGVSGIEPFRWTLIGQLPPGLALSSKGVVSGTPTASATYPFQLGVTDATGQTGTEQCSIAVGAPSLSIGSCPLPAASTASAYSQSLKVSGGTPPYTWSLAGSLPAGLGLSPDGTISGTAQAAGPFLFRLLVADGAGNQAGEPCSLSVTRGPLSIGSCPLTEAGLHRPYQQILDPIGGVAPYVWTYSGNLPPGIDVSPAGVVSGSATQAGQYSLSLTLTDSTAASVTQSCGLSVTPSALRVSTTCPLPAAKLGQPYQQTFSAEGGTPPYSFSVYGYLPAGLSAGNDGSISGTPSGLGNLSFLVQVTDLAGNAAQNACSVGVVLPPAPSFALTGFPASVPPANGGLQVKVQTDQAYSLPVNGRAELIVTADTGAADGAVNRADPTVRFMNGQTGINFTIPAGAGSVTLPVASSGTVASTITATITSLRAGGATLTGPPAPIEAQIPPSPPVLTSACYTTSSTGVTVSLTGYSTTRELKKASISFNPSGAVDSPTSFTVDASGAAANWFSSDDSVRYGGGFTLQIPFAIGNGTPSNLGTITAGLTNSQGSSGTKTATTCP